MSTLQPSMVPSVLDALVVLATTATASDPKFKVLDGPTMTMDTLPKFVLIGWSGQPDTRGVETELRDGGAGGRRIEAINVHGLVQVQLGAGSQKVARDAAFAVFDKLAAAIKQDPTLGVKQGSRAVLSQHAVEPYVGDAGGCAVHFTIHIEGTR